MPPAVNQMPHVIGLGPPLGSGGDIVISPTPEPPTEWVPPTQNPPSGPHVLPEPRPEPGSVGPGKQSAGGTLPGMEQPGVNKAEGNQKEGKKGEEKGKGKDIKQVDDVGKQFGMDEETRREFGRYIEETKGGRDLTFQELIKAAEEFLGLR